VFEIKYKLYAVNETVRDIIDEIIFNKEHMKNATKREIDYMIPELFPDQFMKALDILSSDIELSNKYDLNDWGVNKVIETKGIIIFEIYQSFIDPPESENEFFKYLTPLRYYIVFIKRTSRGYLIRLDTDSLVKIEDTIKNLLGE